VSRNPNKTTRAAEDQQGRAIVVFDEKKQKYTLFGAKKRIVFWRRTDRFTLEKMGQPMIKCAQKISEEEPEDEPEKP
jgi:hypothetical protein